MEVLVVGQGERNLPQQLDGDGALLQELGQENPVAAAKVSELRPGNRRSAEPDVLLPDRFQHVLAEALGVADDFGDDPSRQLRLRGESGHGDGLLRDGDAIPGAEGAGEVLHHGAAHIVDGSAPEDAVEEADLVRGGVKRAVVHRNGRALVLSGPGLEVFDGDGHWIPLPLPVRP